MSTIYEKSTLGAEIDKFIIRKHYLRLADQLVAEEPECL